MKDCKYQFLITAIPEKDVKFFIHIRCLFTEVEIVVFISNSFRNFTSYHKYFFYFINKKFLLYIFLMVGLRAIVYFYNRSEIFLYIKTS